MLRLFLLCILVSFASFAAAGCSSAVGSGDTTLVVQILDDSVTLENQTGASLTRGEIVIMPRGGITRPYTMVLPYMSSGAKRSFAFGAFRMSDGSPFRPDVAKGRSVTITATDAAGKTYTREVPFP